MAGMSDDATLPGGINEPWLPGVTQIPDDEYREGRLRTLTRPAKGIVFHSGSKQDNVAEYAEHEPDGRSISYHFAWSRTHDALVQMVPLTHRAWHCGSAWNHWLGIALSGPYEQDPRSDHELSEVKRVVGLLVTTQPQLKWWTRHSILAPARRKDPGPGFKDEVMQGMGLELYLPPV